MPQGSNSTLVSTRLDVTYSASQDRMHLLVWGNDANSAFWLTRRLCRALLKAMIDLMTRTSEMASCVSDGAQEVLLFEHVDAITRNPVQRPPAEPTPRPGDVHPAAEPPPPQLLDEVTLSIKAGRLSIEMVVKGQRVAIMSLERDNVHQLISILHDRASVAEWNLGEFTWLHRRGNFFIPDQRVVN